MVTPIIKRKFVPEDLDCADWSQIEPLCESLLNREINSAEELIEWLLEILNLMLSSMNTMDDVQ